MDKQIIKFNGKNCFMEVTSEGFKDPLNKVRLNFATYDLSKQPGDRQQSMISIYINIDEFEALAQDILSGRMAKLAKNAKTEKEKTGQRYCKPVYTLLGGTSAKRLASQNKSRPDGLSISRQFKILPGDKAPWILKAEQGAGKENETGLIVPQGNPESYIQVPLSDNDFKKFALMVSKHLQAFRTAEWTMQLIQEAKEAKQANK